MKNFFIFIFSLFILIQCNSSKKESPFDFFCEPFSLSNAKVGDIPFVSYYPDIESKFGSPTSVRDSCSGSGILYKQAYKEAIDKTSCGENTIAWTIPAVHSADVRLCRSNY